MIKNTEKLILQTHNGIVLCRGVNGAGEKFWVYLAANKAALQKMDSDYKHGKVVNFLHYGEIIKFGVSDEVPDDVKLFMKENYGFKHGS